jgi:hypothetical protein
MPPDVKKVDDHLIWAEPHSGVSLDLPEDMISAGFNRLPH